MMTGLMTVNCEAEVTGLDIEFTETVTGPVPTGVELDTTAIIWELVQLVMEAAGTPLKLTEPWDPKFDPVMVTGVPNVPTSGDTLATNGVVPTMTETLSNVAVPSLAAKPM